VGASHKRTNNIINVTIFGKVDRYLKHAVELLRQQNVHVHIHGEREYNVIRIRESHLLLLLYLCLHLHAEQSSGEAEVKGLACVNLKWLSVVENKPRTLKGVEGLTKLTGGLLKIYWLNSGPMRCLNNDIDCPWLLRRRRRNGIVVEDEEAMCKSRVDGFSFRVCGFEL
ncbi:hypothetical protein Dimus_016040, partial [Dionaea muscipula]